MATRPLIPRLSLSLTRSVVHHARPPRVPAFRDPHAAPAAPRPTEGTAVTHPAALGDVPAPSTSSVPLEGTNYTFHHSPPPTAPSYTTGTVPEFLRWTAGEQVHLTGEQAAPLRRPTRDLSPLPEWSQEMKNKIIEMRAIGRSRSEIAKELNIPREEYHRISKLAPLSKAQAADIAAKLELQKSSWGERKSLARAIRERRKRFW